jgi:dihydroneopterin aldolase
VSEHLDVVYIRDLVFDAILGVLPEERTTPQPVCINLEVSVDTRRAAASCDLKDTLDYARLAAEVRALCIDAQCLLVETLAEKIASLTLQQAHVHAVTVDVMKPAALADCQGVGVRITRHRT